MELAEVMRWRPVPGAGLLVGLTRRCPLRCAHCSTSSTPYGADPGAQALLRFVGSFRADNRPEVLLLTGGEPLLRPELAADLAAVARSSGTRSVLLSGMFFARAEPVPARIRRAVETVDHFSASLDAHHEREVSRAAVFRVVAGVLDAGTAVSFHLTGSGATDPYLAEAIADIRRTFGDQVPMLVNTVRAVGRAATWATAARAGTDPLAVAGCAMAAWPVVAFDGTVLACCNQDVVDRRPAPEHLRLGHLDADDWSTVRDRVAGAPVLRMLRSVGPSYLRARYAADPGRVPAAGYCAGCRGLADEPGVLAAARAAGRGAAGALLDREAARRQFAAGPVDLVRRHGCAAYAELVDLPTVAPSDVDVRE